MGFFNRLVGNSPCKVHFDADNIVEVERGTSIMEAGTKAGFAIEKAHLLKPRKIVRDRAASP